MKRVLKLLAVVMAFALTMTATALISSAVDYTMDDADTAFVTAFDKILTVDTDSVVPNVTFEFSIEGTDEGGEGSVINIEPGPAGATVGTAVFTNSDTLDAEGKVTKAVTVSLKNCEFTAPGVYRYIISETSENQNGVTYDANRDRYLDVYVIDDNGVLKVDSYVLRNTADALTKNNEGQAVYDAEDADTKSSSYTNEYTSYDLEFSKTITGNQADKNATFPFTLNITNAAPGIYNIKLADNSQTTITVADDGTFTGTYELGDGESIKVFGLSVGAAYTVTETDPDDYAVSNATDEGTAETDADAAGTMDTDHSIVFTNTRDGIIPTGVILTIAPFAVGILLFGAVIVFMLSRRRRAEY